jgi:hypothetical protein
MHKLKASNSTSKAPHQKMEKIMLKIVQFRGLPPPSAMLIFQISVFHPHNQICVIQTSKKY